MKSLVTMPCYVGCAALAHRAGRSKVIPLPTPTPTPTTTSAWVVPLFLFGYVQKRAPLKQTAYYANDICDGTAINTRRLVCRPGVGLWKWKWKRMGMSMWLWLWMSEGRQWQLEKLRRPGWTTRRLANKVEGCLSWRMSLEDFWICLFVICHVLDSLSSVWWRLPFVCLWLRFLIALVNIPLPIEFVSIYLLHTTRQRGAQSCLCAARPITTWRYVLWQSHPQLGPAAPTAGSIGKRNRFLCVSNWNFYQQMKLFDIFYFNSRSKYTCCNQEAR